MSDQFQQLDAQLFYRGMNIWDKIANEVIDLTITDNLGDKADEITLSLRNDHGKWFDAWFPEHGDELRFVCEGRDMGTYFVDQPNPSGSRSGDIFALHGQSKPVDRSLKTRKTKAFENQTQKEIAQKVCRDAGLQIIGTPPDVQFARVTQRRENDLEFLSRLASDYGAYFAVKGHKVIYAQRDDLHGQDPVRTLIKGANEIINYNLKHESTGTYSKAKASYFDGNSKKNIELEVNDSDVKTGDTLRVDDRVESSGHAQKLAKSKLQKANQKAWSATFELERDPSAQAGLTVSLAGYGRWDRKYIIQSARHHYARGGDTTSLELSDARTAT